MKITLRWIVIGVLLVSVSGILADCGGGGGGAPPPPYSQADLAGTWYVSILQTGPGVTGSEPGWMRGWATVDASGNITITSLDSSSGTFPPSALPWGVVWTINSSTGVISESAVTGSIYANPDFHGKLASNKKIIVGTATNQNATTGTVMQLRVVQKLDPSVTFSTADIQSKTFMFHQIESGTGGDWVWGGGSTDADKVLTIGTMTRPGGTSPGGVVGTLSIHPGTGIVALSTNPKVQGMMSPDKTYMVLTETNFPDTGIFRLSIVQMTDITKTYTQADLAGTWSFHGIVSAGAWLHATASIDASGNGTLSSWTDSGGGPTPGPFTSKLSSDGTITDATDPTDPTLHGALSLNEDLWVITQTMTGSVSAMSIAVK